MRLLTLGAAALACVLARGASAAPDPPTAGPKRNPEAATPDPTNETEETNASGARTAIETNARVGVGIPKTTGRDPLEEEKAKTGEKPAPPEAERPQRRFSFWDRFFGRDKAEAPGAPPAR